MAADAGGLVGGADHPPGHFPDDAERPENRRLHPGATVRSTLPDCASSPPQPVRTSQLLVIQGPPSRLNGACKV